MAAQHGGGTPVDAVASRPGTDAWVRQVSDDSSERRLDALLPRLSPDVDRPDGSRRLHGRAAAHSRTEQGTRDLQVAIGAVVHLLQLDGPSIQQLDIVPLVAAGTPAPAADSPTEGTRQ